MKFSDLDLHPLLQQSLSKIEFSECTPIQELAIPKILAGHDVAGLAQTGTGKTAAFLLPLMDRILRGMEKPAAKAEAAPEPTVAEAGTADAGGAPKEAEEVTKESEEAAPPEEEKPLSRVFEGWHRRNFVLVLVPTRELAEQVYENVLKLRGEAALEVVAVYGGTSYEKQKGPLARGVQFVVATPGRLMDLYKEHIIDLKQVRAVVFDEADRMFDMGFKDDMKFILRRIPSSRQFLVFSATLNFDVLHTAYQFGANPVEISVSKDQAKAENVKDFLFHVGQDEKGKYLLSLIKRDNPKQTIIFSNFKHNVDRITRFLVSNGVQAMGISSLLSQAQRNRVMEQFKNENEMNVLVATDLAARGLDVKGVDMVVNFELPDDPENYVHRIGRTGRAGATGRAYSFVSDRDVDALTRIQEFLKNKVEVDWMEDKDLVTEMRDFPRDEGRRSGPRPQRGLPVRGGDRGDRGDRSDRGGRGRQQEPRRERNGEQGPQRDRPRYSAEGGGRPSHRDRRTGRHGGPERAENASGARGPNRQEGRPGRPQDKRRFEGRGHEGRPQEGRGHEGRSNDRRPQHQNRGQKPQQRFERRGPASAVPPKGLGAKVAGFFKRLFGQ